MNNKLFNNGCHADLLLGGWRSPDSKKWARRVLKKQSRPTLIREPNIVQYAESDVERSNSDHESSQKQPSKIRFGSNFRKALRKLHRLESKSSLVRPRTLKRFSDKVSRLQQDFEARKMQQANALAVDAEAVVLGDEVINMDQ